MEEINNSLNKNDMATAAKSIECFSGGAEEDVILWILEVRFTRAIIGGSEEDMKRVILLKLRGAARSWASEVIGESVNGVTLDELIELLINRFSSQQQTEVTLSKFLTERNPSSREEFTDLLKHATGLYKKGYMNIVPLTQVVIKKSPTEIKSLLVQAAETLQTWDQFIKRAEDIAWIAFPDKCLNRIERKDVQVSEKQYCEWHETNSHNTRNCKFFNRLKELYKRRGKQVSERNVMRAPVQYVRPISELRQDQIQCLRENTEEEDINEFVNKDLNI